MDNYNCVGNILNKLVIIKRKINLNSLKIGHLNPKSNLYRIKSYHTTDFLWLNIVLSSLKVISIREKINFLTLLHNSKNSKNLIRFYKFIGLDSFSTNIPSVGFFSDYVKYFDELELENLTNKALKLIAENNNFTHEFNLYSVDGKDIRNCGGTNIKSINAMCNGVLIDSFHVDSEQSWIKNNLTIFIKDNFIGNNNVFIGDGAYHNTKIRRFFSQNGFLAILPMKKLTNLFKKRLNTVQDINTIQNKHVTINHVDKRNKSVIEETVKLIPVKNKFYRELNQWTYIVEIISLTTHIKTNIINSKTRRFLTNLNLPATTQTARTIRDLIKQHWRVETFHQYKDYNLLEDKYYKSREKAAYKSMINNLAYLIQKTCGFDNKHKIDALKMNILLLIAFLFTFLTEQH